MSRMAHNVAIQYQTLRMIAATYRNNIVVFVLSMTQERKKKYLL